MHAAPGADIHLHLVHLQLQHICCYQPQPCMTTQDP